MYDTSSRRRTYKRRYTTKHCICVFIRVCIYRLGVAERNGSETKRPSSSSYSPGTVTQGTDSKRARSSQINIAQARLTQSNIMITVAKIIITSQYTIRTLTIQLHFSFWGL